MPRDIRLWRAPGLTRTIAAMKKPLGLTAAIGARPVPARGSAAGEAARLSELAVQFEELLDQVWRCEREWELDDRISFACRRYRR